ncbi:FAD-dependent monooxygenase [Microvirga sp. BT688]|uniref:FAD-dependent monooxygenase n=1 Tax=Microvirga sp. TaxID=1873136 RepID=UPI0016871987|nr:FAD-dependent monooxygenase [Microvirga sp.]MBD2750223.1 FAD-dependent monooxygenase [Microvirga sp.]
MNTDSNVTHCDVLIAGGGPVGLALGSELGRRGIECLVVDSKPGLHDRPRAAVIGPRTVEFFRRWGIADRVLAAGMASDYPIDVVFTDRLIGEELGRLSYPSQGEVRARAPSTLENYPPLDWSPYTKTIIGQQALEPVIYEYFSGLPCCTSAYSTVLTGFAQDEDGVTATVQSSDGTVRKVRAKYLAGCDGGRSDVRRALGIKMSGTNKVGESVNIFFKAPRLIPALGKKPGFLLWSFAPGATGSFLAIAGRELWVFQRYLVAGETFENFDAVAALRSAIGTDIDAEVIDYWNWIPRQLVAETFQSGRVFLAGDSAHLMPPSGGLGLNTGVGDAMNLAWKLDATLRGWGGNELLRSYTSERRPVAVRNSEESANNRAIMHETMHAAVHIQDEGEAGMKARAEFQRLLPLHNKHFDGVGLYLGDDYDGSTVVVPDGSPAPERSALFYSAVARPGRRLPHFWLDDGRSVFDRLGPDFTLITSTPDEIGALVTAFQERGVPLEVLALMKEDMSRYGARHVLVRPDGHVGWRGSELVDSQELVDRVTGRTLRS